MSLINNILTYYSQVTNYQYFMKKKFDKKEDRYHYLT